MDETFLRQLKKIRNTTVVSTLLFVVLGVVMLVWPDSSALAICYVLGTMALLCGLIEIVCYFVRTENRFFATGLVSGILSALLGLYILWMPHVILVFLYLLLGILLLVFGCSKVADALTVRRFALTGWWIPLLLGAITIILGALVLCNPFSAAATLMVAIGIGLIVEGVLDIFNILNISKQLKKALGDDMEDYGGGL